MKNTTFGCRTVLAPGYTCNTVVWVDGTKSTATCESCGTVVNLYTVQQKSAAWLWTGYKAGNVCLYSETVPIPINPI